MARIKIKIKSLLDKSRDSALLAVEVYNKPRTSFRSAGFIVLMHIAWTSLFHAIFEKRNVSYFYKKNKVRYETVDGERKAWELSKCISEYYGSNITPERKNLEFFIKLRNKIEHRFVPEIDQEIFGECQAMLVNYENLITQEFGEKFAINENLAFSLQFSKILHPQQILTVKKKQSNDYKDIKKFITNYRSRLKKNIIDSLNYNFRVYLIPKVGNHKTSSDFAIEFVKYDLEKPEEAENYKRFIVAVKEKQVPVEGLRAGEVAKKIQEALKTKMPVNWKFTPSNHHSRCWKFYKIRPRTGDANPAATIAKYCFYDKTFDQYGYTNEWVSFLVDKLSDLEEYKKVMKTN